MIKIYTTLDCIKLNKFETMLLAVIKGVLYDYHHSISGHYLHNVDKDVKSITISPVKEISGLTKFKITNTAIGVFEDVKRIVEPFSFGMQMQGGFNKEDNTTTFIIQRFEIKRSTMNFYERV